ncbi:ERI1 exoribonuclease 2 isoform X1 [Malaclemys terrapin pileata]|uniref:ERI1 exoribonuclease 2 isoform X1 n=2 Tax=Malaclemys terrapin pileata TaxID=2991368 RepID=UPI0023A81E73|nr:ERI1 exoribonuclease 2 isoform X1 [Malaclemys terrapin pileata]
MATKQLARQLGLIRKSSITSSNGKNQTRTKSRQSFDYLIIIDFESTCWKDGKRHYSQEIIEFPAVLLNTSTGEIESEFHMYVQPEEHPILSEFCTELTGIKQNQVDEGVPLNICLSQFSKWIQKIQKEKKIIFNSDVSSHSVSEAKSSTFVTWSDWDLGVCLQYECKRKQLRKPDILNSWIDLRATYKLFYTRKPKGLNGALQDLGIDFAGREHSGLDDSRNTARLAWRMICDGCVMKITKSLDKVHPKKNSVSRSLNVNPTEENPLGSDDGAETSAKDRICNSSCLAENEHNKIDKMVINSNVKGKDQQESSSTSSSANVHVGSRIRTKIDGCGQTQSCLPPYIGRLPVPFGQLQASHCNLLTGIQNGLNNGHLISTSKYSSSILGSGLVLVSTTISSVNISNVDISTSSDCLSMLADWEDVALIPESQHEENTDSVKLKDDPDAKTSSVSGEGMVLKEPSVKNSDFECLEQRNEHLEASKSIVYKSPNTTIYDVGLAQRQALNCSAFKLPSAKVNATLSSTVLIGNHSTPFSQTPKRKPSSPKTLPPSKKQSFTVHEDEASSSDQPLSLRNSSSYKVPTVLLNSTVCLNQSLKAVKSDKLTPPLCNCGRRAKRLNVSSAGPNHGKVFYSCPVGKHEGKKRGCGYFKWEHVLLKEKSTNAISTLSPTAAGLTSPGINSDSSGNSHRKYPGLRPSMRT